MELGRGHLDETLVETGRPELEGGTMEPHAAWPWSESLGAIRAGPGQVLRVRRILFGMVRDRCHEVGLEEGTELRYGDRTPEGVALELSGGGRRILEFPYAWFVQVEPASPASRPVTR